MLNTASRLVLALAVALPGVAAAQGAGSGGPQVEEIIVTAQRREERLQDVPISVSAVTGEGLERAGITDTRQLTQMMPGLVFSRANSSFQPYIRGVGTRNANVGDESNVSVYIDGVYQPVMSALGFDLANIERVEVLRGPQGTLFGRNSTGGLINVITRPPSFEPGGRVSLRAGNYGEYSAQLYVTGPINDGLAADFTYLYAGDDGYIKDLVRGGHSGDRTSELIRGKLLLEPTDRFQATLTATYSDIVDGSSVNNQPLFGNTEARTLDPVPLFGTEPWESALDRTPEVRSRVKSIDLQTRYEATGFNIETTSSFQSAYSLTQTDNDGSVAPINLADVSQYLDYMSNELRLLSTTDGPLSWIVGAYLFNGEGEFRPLQPMRGGVPGPKFYTKQGVDSWAVFGEANYDLGERWRIIGGLRYTEEERDFRSDREGTVLVPLQEASFDELTYRASLMYRFGREANVYFTYSRGFKSGVFNGFATSLAAAQATDPEILDSYEVGFKADPLPWLRVNAAAFHYDYKDIQQSARSPTSSLVVLFNAASSKMDGAEIEITAAATEDLNLRFYATYLDAEYESFPTAQVFQPILVNGLPAGNRAVSPYDASGKDMLRAPKFTLGFNFDYSKLTEMGVFGVTGNVFYSDKYYWEFENRIKQPAYTMVNGEVFWSTSDDPRALRIGVYGRNLLDEVVYAQVLTSAQGDVVGFDRPLSYGVSLTKSF